jgi:hypothetical protein
VNVLGSMVSSACCFAYLIPVGVMVCFLVLWVIVLVDVLQRHEGDFPQARQGVFNPNERLIWVLVVVLGSGIGSLIYYFLVMKPYPRPRA